MVPRLLLGVALAAAAACALAQGPGSRLLIGSPTVRPAGPPPRTAEATATRKPVDAAACNALRGAARGRCLLEARELAAGQASSGPGSAGASSGAGAGSGAAGAAGGSAPH